MTKWLVDKHKFSLPYGVCTASYFMKLKEPTLSKVRHTHLVPFSLKDTRVIFSQITRVVFTKENHLGNLSSMIWKSHIIHLFQQDFPINVTNHLSDKPTYYCTRKFTAQIKKKKISKSMVEVKFKLNCNVNLFSILASRYG